MSAIISVLALMVFLGYGIFKNIDEKTDKASCRMFWLFAFMCFSVKLFAAALYRGHSTDLDCFWAWSEMLADSGLGAFYESEAFTDYPPGYMYVLYALGTFKNLFNIGNSYYVVLKIPAILCDIVTGYFIYNTAKSRFTLKTSLLISCIYMLNPAVIVNSSLWGQVDSVYTLGLAVVLILLCRGQIKKSILVFAVCVFIKPQSLIFTPILLFSAVEYAFLPEFNSKRILGLFSSVAGALALIVLMALPFGLKNVLEQYFKTLESYPYLTINAFNIWGALGQNWTELTPYFSYLGAAFIVIITILSARVFFYNKGKERYFMTAAFLSFATFMVSVKMHDRYAFPAMLMFLFAFIYSKQKSLLSGFVLISMSQFFNTAWVLFIYEQDINYYAGSITIVIASVINILLFLCSVFLLTGIDLKKIIEGSGFERKSARCKRIDYLIILCITAVYSVFAFCDLGDLKAPKSLAEVGRESTIEIELQSTENIESLFYYLGADAVESDLSAVFYKNDEEVLKILVEEGNAFYWNEVTAQVEADRLILKTDKQSIELFEVVLKNGNGIITPKGCNYPILTDEQELLPERVNFRNSTYFDEIYHARTGYEFVKGKSVYEWTHPPLGKAFIALGIKIFGMTPFGWRIVGTVFGVLMIFVIYALAKRIFKNSFIAGVGCIMFTFDFMHFTQTRIATIDVYVTFFIMLMYYFMYKYYVSNLSFKKNFKHLLFAGISFGLGAACKWTACYACAGLAIIFFLTVARRYRESKEDFWSWFIKTTAFCVLAFIIVPVIIYCVSYIPYMNSMNDFSFSAIWENQKEMLAYHGKTVVDSTHPYSSKWFSWPIIYKPMWYYDGQISDTVKEGISAFGNPAVWWLGIPSFVACVYFAGFRRSKKALFLVIGYLSCLLPWVFVERTTYIYHYFPCVIFSVLMTCFCINKLEFKYRRYAGILVSTTVIILFLLFYPVLSGEAVASVYVDEVLRWFGEWVLIG